MGRPVKRRYDASGRRAAAEATRERICAAAERLFLRDGYVRTSIRAVAREAGVAEATVYLTFSTKSALLNATILRATGAEEGKPLSAILDAPPADMLSRLANAHATAQRLAALPGDRLAEPRIASHLRESLFLVGCPEDLEPIDAEAGAADGEVPPQRPVTRQPDVMPGPRLRFGQYIH